VASARKGLAATQPKLPKGRPSTPAAKAAARPKKRLAAHSTEFSGWEMQVHPDSPLRSGFAG